MGKNIATAMLQTVNIGMPGIFPCDWLYYTDKIGGEDLLDTTDSDIF